MQIIKLVFESLCKMLIRFFDNRAIRNTDVEYYRMELDKQRLETQRLIDRIFSAKPGEMVEIDEAFLPIGKSKFKSWEQKRKELEQASRFQAMRNAEEARMNIERSKTTKELEDELGIANG